MLIEEVMTAWVEEITGITPYPAKLEQEPQLPGITYQVITTPRTHTQDGPTKKPKQTFQFNIWDSTYLGCIQTVATLRQGLDGFRGEKYGTKIDSVFVVNELDGREDSTDRERRILDVTVTHKEV